MADAADTGPASAPGSQAASLLIISEEVTSSGALDKNSGCQKEIKAKWTIPKTCSGHMDLSRAELTHTVSRQWTVTQQHLGAGGEVTIEDTIAFQTDPAGMIRYFLAATSQKIAQSLPVPPRATSAISHSAPALDPAQVFHPAAASNLVQAALMKKQEPATYKALVAYTAAYLKRQELPAAQAIGDGASQTQEVVVCVKDMLRPLPDGAYLNEDLAIQGAQQLAVLIAARHIISEEHNSRQTRLANIAKYTLKLLLGGGEVALDVFTGLGFILALLREVTDDALDKMVGALFPLQSSPLKCLHNINLAVQDAQLQLCSLNRVKESQ